MATICGCVECSGDVGGGGGGGGGATFWVLFGWVEQSGSGGVIFGWVEQGGCDGAGSR